MKKNFVIFLSFFFQIFIVWKNFRQHKFRDFFCVGILRFFKIFVPEYSMIHLMIRLNFHA